MLCTRIEVWDHQWCTRYQANHLASLWPVLFVPVYQDNAQYGHLEEKNLEERNYTTAATTLTISVAAVLSEPQPITHYLFKDYSKFLQEYLLG